MKKKLYIMLIALLSMGHVFAEEGTAKIIILRPCTSNIKYISISHIVYFDGQLFGGIPSRTYWEIIVEPKQHTLIGYVGNKSLDELKSAGASYSLSIDAQSGNTYYACIDEKSKPYHLFQNRYSKKN